MTFEEAYKHKAAIREFVMYGDLKCETLVTPENEVELNNYLLDYRYHIFTDESAKRYTITGRFQVCALKREGSSVACKPQ